MRNLFNVKDPGAPKKGHLFNIGKAPNYGKVITGKIKRLGRVSIPKGKMKLFKLPVRIPRGINIK